jgi:hypothetical protein
MWHTPQQDCPLSAGRLAPKVERGQGETDLHLIGNNGMCGHLFPKQTAGHPAEPKA